VDGRHGVAHRHIAHLSTYWSDCFERPQQVARPTRDIWNITEPNTRANTMNSTLAASAGEVAAPHTNQARRQAQHELQPKNQVHGLRALQPIINVLYVNTASWPVPMNHWVTLVM